jgi:hypothetical protein
MTWTQSCDIIAVLKKKLGFDEDFFTIDRVWSKEVNIEGLEICGYKSGVLFTQTASSSASNELHLRKKEIINKLNQYIGDKKIKNIKVIIE